MRLQLDQPHGGLQSIRGLEPGRVFLVARADAIDPVPHIKVNNDPDDCRAIRFDAVPTLVFYDTSMHLALPLPPGRIFMELGGLTPTEYPRPGSVWITDENNNFYLTIIAGNNQKQYFCLTTFEIINVTEWRLWTLEQPLIKFATTEDQVITLSSPSSQV